MAAPTKTHGYTYHAVEVDKEGRCVEVHYSGEYDAASNMGRLGMKKQCLCCGATKYIKCIVIAGRKPTKGEQILKKDE